ncbi:hypothetical protein FZEAL_5345 [Fusarium zealandicum]|uniref:Uncharacterized protein n=1 Tax=Fusarium zealandicum TaxID=1053134 RepID=A0A8H4UKB9_9HYPO|nr:hypothetical protein FZEAL_5345 [Fusarium zealandicum]
MVDTILQVFGAPGGRAEAVESGLDHFLAILDLVRGQLASGIVNDVPRSSPYSTEQVTPLIETVKGQIRELYTSINKYNPHFWRLMLSGPTTAYGASLNRPSSYSPRTEEEARLIIGYCIASWFETPGSFDAMERASRTT